MSAKIKINSYFSFEIQTFGSFHGHLITCSGYVDPYRLNGPSVPQQVADPKDSS